MDSLLLLCARRVIARRRLPPLPADLYPVLFQLAFLDGRPCVLRDLVAAWPFPVLHVQQLVTRRELLGNHSSMDYVQAIIQGVVAQLRWELEEPSRDSSCQLRVLDMTGRLDSVSSRTPAGWSRGSGTKALATACVAVSRHQEELQRHGVKRHKGCSGVMTAKAPPQPPGVDVHTDLVVDSSSYGILCDVLQTGADGLLRLKCREFHPKHISTLEIVTLLDSLDPSCLRRVDLKLKGLADLLVILPYLSRFPELRSLKLRYSDLDVQHPTSESAIRIRGMARQLGMLPSLRELNLENSSVSGNLRQILCDLQAPLESLELPYSSLVPDDLAFLSQSFYTLALKRLDLSGLNVSQGLLNPLWLLLEKASASLLHLDLSDCHIADSHLAVLLRTLLRCSRLRFLALCGNPLSTAVLKDLLQKTLELPNLYLVVYPIPLDCHTGDPSEFDSDCFDESLDQQLLSAAKAEISQLLKNSGRTDLIWTDNPESLEDLDYFSL
ncbi:LRC14 protein, partial [Catharus fuscescens]|nr:LRC14 protein [Catharus fuscescens]